MNPGVTLLERSVTYALGAVGDVTPAALGSPTPCREWDLRALLEHVAGSMDALLEGLGAGCVGPSPPIAGRRPRDPVTAFRRRASGLLAACASAGGAEPPVIVGDRVLAARFLTWVGAVELAVHGWDVARACGAERPIPAGLARNLLAIVPLVVTDRSRGGLFAPPCAARPDAPPAERLLAFLGRDAGEGPPGPVGGR